MGVVVLHSVRLKLHLLSVKDFKREEIPFPLSRTRGRAPQAGGKVIPIKEQLTTPLRGTNAQLSEFLSSQKTLTHTHARTPEPHLQMLKAVFSPSVSGSSEMKHGSRASSERNSRPGSVCMCEKEVPFVGCLCEWEGVFAPTIKAEI